MGAYVVRGGEVTFVPALDVRRTATVGIVAGSMALLALRSIADALARR